MFKPEQAPQAVSPDEDRARTSSNASGASSDSAHSAVYLIAPESRDSHGILRLPTVSIRLEKADITENGDKAEHRLVLKFGDDRPATIVKGQGRHVSAYLLYREAMIARLHEHDVESVEARLKTFLAEYIETPEALAKFDEYIHLHKNKSGGLRFDKEERKALFEAERKTRDFLKTVIPAETLKNTSLPMEIQDLLINFEKIKASWEAVKTQPIDTRNQLKQGNIFSYQTPLMEMMKGVLTVLNKMEMVAFEDKRTLSRDEKQREMAAQGGKMAAMVQPLRAGYKEEHMDIDFERMTHHLYVLFDYPYPEIIALESKKSPAQITETFYQVVRRHIKVFFDAVSDSHQLPDTEKKDIIKDFLKMILEDGWKELVLDNINIPSKSKNKKPVVDKTMLKNIEKVLYSGLMLENGRYRLTKKFNAELPQTLQMAVEQLEQSLDTLEPGETVAPAIGSSSNTRSKPS